MKKNNFMQKLLTCPECGKQFIAWHSKKYCSTECQIKHNKREIKKRYQTQRAVNQICQLCGEPIEAGRYKAKYCLKCSYELEKQRAREKSRLKNSIPQNINDDIGCTKPNQNIIRLAAEARKLNMSYGQYQQYLYRQKCEAARIC